jgi:hypothetical protein
MDKPQNTDHLTRWAAFRARRRWCSSVPGRDAYVHRGGRLRWFVSYIDYRRPERDPEQQALKDAQSHAQDLAIVMGRLGLYPKPEDYATAIDLAAHLAAALAGADQHRRFAEAEGTRPQSIGGIVALGRPARSTNATRSTRCVAGSAGPPCVPQRCEAVAAVPENGAYGYLVGTSWRGASGHVATVERVERGIAIGRWDSGVLWREHAGMLPRLYQPVPVLREDPDPRPANGNGMSDNVYCLGCGAAFPIDADPYPLNGGMCGPCIAEQRQRPWQILAENDRLRAALREARNCMAWCVNLGADEATAKSLRRGIEVVDTALLDVR